MLAIEATVDIERPPDTIRIGSAISSDTGERTTRSLACCARSLTGSAIAVVCEVCRRRSMSRPCTSTPDDR